MQRQKTPVTAKLFLRLGPCLLVLLLLSCPIPFDQEMLLQVKDEVGPAITILSPEDGSNCARTVIVTGEVEDASTESEDGGRVESMWYEIPGSDISGTVTVAADGSFSFQFPTSDLAPTFLLTVTAEDWNGNLAEASINLKKMAGNDIPSFAAVPGNHEVTLTWDDVPLAASYSLYYTNNGSNPSENYGEQVVDVTSPYPISNLKNGSLHAFLLQAHSTSGPDNWSSIERTIPLSSLTLAPRVTGEYDRIRVEWTGIPGTDTYEVWRTTDQDGPFLNISGAVQGHSYVDTLVDDDTVYYYHVTIPVAENIASEVNCARTLSFNDEFERIVGSYPTQPQGNANGITIVGDRAYLAAGTAGLMIFDITAPSTPVLLGSYDTEGAARAVDVDIDNDIAYVAAGSDLVVLDIANLSDIGLVGSGDTMSARDVKISGDYAYVADLNSVKVFNVANPPDFPIDGSYNCMAMGIAVNGTIAYVSGIEQLTVLDIVAPVPSLLGSCELPGWGMDVVLSGSYALVADYSEGLQIIDISDPANPKIAAPDGANYDTPGAAQGITLSGSHAYVADWSAGVHVVDLTEPLDPTLLRSFDTPGAASNVAVGGNFAFVADYSEGLQVIDASAPPAPEPVLSYEVPARCEDIELWGDLGYIADGAEGWLIVDFAVPSSPGPATVYDTAGSCLALDVCGRYVFVADGGEGLQIFDTSKPQAESLVGSYSALAGARGVVVLGDYAYLIDSSTGLNVFDVSVPSAPELKATHGAFGIPRGMAAREPHLFITDSAVGLEIFEISSPEDPQLVGTLDVGGSANGVAIVGETCYLGDYTVGVLEIDVTNPSLPVETGRIELPDAAGIAITQGYTFVASEGSGFHVLYTGGASDPFLVSSFGGTPSVAYDVEISGGHAFVNYPYDTSPVSLQVFDIFPAE